VCLPKGAAAPDPRAYARVSGGAGAGAAPGGKCYGDNLAAAADIASTGSYFGDVGARSASAAITERARQEIATADRLEAAGKIDEAAHALRVASATARAATSGTTAAAPSTGALYAPGMRTRGYDGRVIKNDELQGVCGAPPRGPVFCKTTWPGGFRGLLPDGSAPGAPWIPATEEVGDAQLVNARTGAVTTVKVSRLVAGPNCYPNGQPWWTRGAAWAARAAVGTAEASADLLASAARNVASGVTALGAIGVTPVGPGVGGAVPSIPGAPTPPALVCYRKTTWPGGTICVPAGTPPPTGPWERV